jgi:phosphoribosylaminoimidazole-succinocarboxamide synthase
MTFDLKKMVLETQLPYPRRRGKVRDVYDLGDRMLMVSTDRISAFDWILPVGIPGKGIVLNQLSCFWFQRLNAMNHMMGTDVNHLPELSDEQRLQLAGRSMITRKAQVIPFECVVRGYLEGSGWREYQKSGCVCGIPLPPGLKQCDRLPVPIFTPATKAEQGHDINVSFHEMSNALGSQLSQRLCEESLAIYQQGSQWALEKGIIIADTKFEWGWCDGELTLIDEVLTPDSSRFWPLEQYRPGTSQPSFDKQFVREWLLSTSWDQHSPPPALPEEVIQQTREKYLSVYRLLTDSALLGSQH